MSSGFAFVRGTILLVGKFFLWPLCELPDFCLVRDDGPTPSRQSAFFPHKLCGSGDCLDSGYGSFSVSSALDFPLPKSRNRSTLRLPSVAYPQ